jgi:glycine/D-amino acid oxidase-like deaminating enzyme
VLEAERVGAGASGRNSGMIGPGVGGWISGLRRRRGDHVAAAMFQSSLDAVDAAIELVRHEGISCELQIGAQLKVAATAGQVERLRREAGSYAALGFDVPWLGRDEVSQAIGARDYLAALRFRRAATVDPARLCLGLRRALERRGVRVFEASSVRRVRGGRPVRLELEGGTVEAETALIATNGYTPQLGLFCGRVIPLQTHMILTEPLEPDRIRSLAWSGREAIIESRNFFNYYRLTPDGRIAFGGGRALYRASPGARAEGATDQIRPRACDDLRRELVRLFPDLEGASIASGWSGTMGFTLDNLPIVGEVPGHAGVHFAGAWCGHGLALSIANGAMFADLVASRANARSDLPWQRSSAPRLPSDPWRGVGLSAYLSALEWSDRAGRVLSQNRREAAMKKSIDRIDVAVVGGGLSGLHAARLLRRRGIDVVLFEARARVGGRTFTRDHDSTTVDEGGQFVCPAQTEIVRVAAELGIEAIPVFRTGEKILGVRGEPRRYAFVPPLAGDAFAQSVARLDAADQLAEQIDPERPWEWEPRSPR